MCNRFVCLLVAGEEFKMGLGEGGGELKTELGIKMSKVEFDEVSKNGRASLRQVLQHQGSSET